MSDADRALLAAMIVKLDAYIAASHTHKSGDL
jgi:hypothetical protein